MDLPSSIALHTLSRASLWPYTSKNSHLLHRKGYRIRLECKAKHVRVELSSENDKDASLNGNRNLNRENSVEVGSIWESSEFLEVIGFGSRKDAIVDFCFGSPFLSPALRFWYALCCHWLFLCTKG
ncbi:unnamed protein product [Ilex paraguariensis]|uniref:Uncharacterized protein n=1 Tax=Ilex paraguariensis TaxID=185542 RepID=A0ABC8RU77_9AQUA